MKLLAAIFAFIALSAAVLGFAMDVMPVLALLGKLAALIALAGFTIVAVACVSEKFDALYRFDADDIHP